jgi:hypothetical protein
VRLPGANKTLVSTPAVLQQFQVGFACGTNQPIENVYINNITDSATAAIIPYNTTTYRANGNTSCGGTANPRLLGLARTLQALGGVDLTFLILNPSVNITTRTPAELQADLTPLLQSVATSVGSTGFSLVTPASSIDSPNTGIASSSGSSNSLLLIQVLVPIATLAVVTMMAVLITIYRRNHRDSRTLTRTVRFDSDEMPIKPRVSRSESVKVMMSPLQIRV